MKSGSIARWKRLLHMLLGSYEGMTVSERAKV